MQRATEFMELECGFQKHRIQCTLTEERHKELDDYLTMYDMRGYNSFFSLVGWARERNIEVRAGAGWFSLFGFLSNLTLWLSNRLYDKDPRAFAEQFQPERRR